MQRPARFGIVLALFAVFVAPAEAAKKTDKGAKQQPAAQDTTLDNIKDAPKSPALACEGPFAKDTTHAKLAADFGAKNVVFKDIDTPANVLVKATVLFDDDPSKRIVVQWSDPKARAKPTSVAIQAPSTWTGPGGIRNGLPLKEFETLNGPFSLTGFGGVNGGVVSGLREPFANVAGGCTLRIKFEPGIANPLPPRFASVTGDQAVPSKNLILRRVRPQVSEWGLIYP